MSLSLPVFVFVSVGYMHTYIYSRSLNKYPSPYTYTVQCVQEKSKRPVEGITSWDFEKYDCAKIIGMILPSCFSKYSCFFFSKVQSACCFFGIFPLRHFCYFLDFNWVTAWKGQAQNIQCIHTIISSVDLYT